MAKKPSKLEQSVVSQADETTVKTKTTKATKPVVTVEPLPEIEIDEPEQPEIVPEELNVSLLESSEVPALSLVETIALEIPHTINQLSVKRINQLSEHIIGYDYRVRFKDHPGRTHYKFLQALSTYFNQSLILDASLDPLNSLALAYNESNTVVYTSKFDHIVNSLLRKWPINNVCSINDRYYVEDPDNPDTNIRSSHTGQIYLLSNEGQFNMMSKTVDFKGKIIVVLDIAIENSLEKDLWDSFPTESKVDMSKYVSESGAGIIVL